MRMGETHIQKSRLFSTVKRMIAGLIGAAVCAACSPQVEVPEVQDVAQADNDILILGQDLDAYRGYVEGGVGPAPDGITQYLKFFNLLNGERAFGGLGLNAEGEPIDVIAEWGGGPTNAWTSTQISDGPYLAIGLSLAEHEHEGLEAGALARVTAGEYDAEIEQLVRFALMTDKTILLRIGYEFEGAWNIGYHRFEDYRAAYIRIAARLREAGADNVKFVWQAAASPIDDVLDGGRETISNWYPGDEWVDWVGVSIFIPPDEAPLVDLPTQPPLARELLDEMLDFARAHDKPVLIAEATPQGYQLDRMDNAHITVIWDGPSGEGVTPMTADEIWQGWYQPLFDYMAENDDVIDGLAYINADWDAQGRWDAPYQEGYWGDTRLELNQTIAQRWQSAVETWREN